jgi:hypothetical protein
VIVQLRTYGPMRLVLIGVALLICVAWAGVALFVHTGYPNGPSPAPGTQQQIAAARAMLQTLPPVAGAGVDRYDTACEQSRTWCLTSTTLTPQQLMPEALAMLKTHGATVSSHSCAKQRIPWPLCNATLHYRGTRLTVSSDALFVALSLSASTDSRTTLSVSVDGAAAPVVPQPLGSWASMNPLPASWPVDPPCVTRTPQGSDCEVYQRDRTAATAFPGTLDAATATAVASLNAHGFAVHRICLMTHGSVGPHCVLTVKKFRSPGGSGGITGSISVEQRSAATVSIQVYLAAAAS